MSTLPIFKRIILQIVYLTLTLEYAFFFSFEESNSFTVCSIEIKNGLSKSQREMAIQVFCPFVRHIIK